MKQKYTNDITQSVLLIETQLLISCEIPMNPDSVKSNILNVNTMFNIMYLSNTNNGVRSCHYCDMCVCDQ